MTEQSRDWLLRVVKALGAFGLALGAYGALTVEAPWPISVMMLALVSAGVLMLVAA